MAVFNVKHFGAKGDGEADDTQVIQHVFSSAREGSIISFPDGIYKVSDSLVLSTKNVTIEGRKSTIVQTGLNKKTIHISNANNVSLKDLCLIGVGTENIKDTTSYNGVAGIYLTDSLHCKISSCTIKNHSGSSIRWTGTCSGLKVVENVIEGIGEAGGIAEGDNGNDVGVGGYLTVNERNVVIRGNDISGHCFGIFFSRATNNVVQSNIIHDIPGQHGMYLGSCSYLSVTNNVIYNTAYIGISNQIATSGVVLKGNVVQNNLVHDTGKSGIGFNVTPSASSTSRYYRTLISNNNIIDVGEYGISTELCIASKINSNTIDNCINYGVICLGWSGTIVDNDIQNTGWNPILLQLLDKTTIKNNTISNGCMNYLEEASGYRINYYVYIAEHASKLVASPYAEVIDNSLSIKDGMTYWGYINTEYTNVDNLCLPNKALNTGVTSSLVKERLYASN